MWGLAAIGMRLALLLFVGEGVVVGGTWLVNAGRYNDPFAPYEAILPDQIVAAASDKPCEPQIAPGYIEAISCEIHAMDGHFELVTGNVSNGKFVHIMFSANNLYVGDIVRRWGRPDVVVRDHQVFYVMWDDQGLYGIIDPVGAIGRFSYMLPVESLTIGLQPHKSH